MWGGGVGALVPVLLSHPELALSFGVRGIAFNLCMNEAM